MMKINRDSICLFLLFSTFFCSNQLNGQIINTIAGSGTPGYTGDGGQAIAADLDIPVDVTIDNFGNFYIVDRLYPRIRKVSPTGIISTVAGNGLQGFSGDGGLAVNAKLNNPSCIIIDAIGNMYIADHDNGRVRMVNTSGFITTIAGTGGSFSGDGGPAVAAGGLDPSGLALDAFGNLYISCEFDCRIRKVNSSGIISTIGGNGTQGFSGDGGQATLAQLNHPERITVDSIGNLYIAEYSNNCIRKIETNGIITTIAGNIIQGFSGDGGQATSAKLFNPTGVTIDAAGNLYITDSNNNRVRKVDGLGIITTIAGNGTQGFGGDGGPAISAELFFPCGITVDVFGNLFVADVANNRIRIICAIGSLRKNTNLVLGNTFCTNNSLRNFYDKKNFVVYPNTCDGIFYIETNSSEKQNVQIFDLNGRLVLYQSINEKTKIDASNLADGIYNLMIKTGTGVLNKKLVIAR